MFTSESAIVCISLAAHVWPCLSTLSHACVSRRAISFRERVSARSHRRICSNARPRQRGLLTNTYHPGHNITLRAFLVSSHHSVSSRLVSSAPTLFHRHSLTMLARFSFLFGVFAAAASVVSANNNGGPSDGTSFLARWR